MSSMASSGPRVDGKKKMSAFCSVPPMPHEMRGKTCLVTGSTSGIGKETARALSGMGASLVLVARDASKGQAVKSEIVRSTGNEDVEILECDLSDMSSISGACSRFAESHDRLDVLINDAGVWERMRSLSKDGIEMTFAVNHLAPFLMTNLLLDLLRKSAPSRIVSVSSGLHGGTVHFDDVEFSRRFNGMAAYRQSKLSNILFVKELSRRLAGSGVTANCLMPGFVATGLFRNASVFTRVFVKGFASRPSKGAETSVYLASSPEVESVSGECFRNKMVAKTSRESNDRTLAERLWALSEKYTAKWLEAGH
jgi:NAD(P)-dependent dehydrogenase (short-subunit alcohol dehydrogenase family)